MKNFIFGIVLTGISILIGFGLFEAYVRVFETDGQNFDIEMWRYAQELKRVSDIPGRGHEHIPGRTGVYMGAPVEINSVGWRDKDYPLEKPDGAVRIMMLGDSLTFGWGANLQDVTSFRLEEILNARGDRTYEVLNTGIGNTNTAMQSAYFVNEGYRYKPDIVVLNYFINDAESTPGRKESFLVDNFYAAVFLAGRLDTLFRSQFNRGDYLDYYQALYQAAQPGWRAAKQAVDALAEFARTNGIRLVVVNYPELHQLSPYPFQSETDLLKAHAEARQLPFLDLLPSVVQEEPRSLWVTPTDAHPNGLAAGHYATSLAAFLAQTYPELF